jgi:hypothetical protein
VPHTRLRLSLMKEQGLDNEQNRQS